MSDSNLTQQWKHESGEQSMLNEGKFNSSSAITSTTSSRDFLEIDSTLTNLRPNNIPIVLGSSVTLSNDNFFQHQELQKCMSLTKGKGCGGVLGGLQPRTAIDSFPNEINALVNAISSELTKKSRANSDISNTTASVPNSMTDEEKLRKMQQIVEAGIGDQAKQQILQILEKISALKPAERLLLYLRMPGGAPETDPLRQPQNPLGTRSEINHTINWVRSHLEHDPEVSIPKQDVYNDYIAYCERLDIKPLSTADFGKVMKQVFPEIRPRRLGTRGHSRYCYAAMRKTTKLSPPQLPELGTKGTVSELDHFNLGMEEDEWKAIKIWSEGMLSTSFQNYKELAEHIHKHQLNTPASNSSRLLLQKKLLQKEAKEKRKFTDTGPLKKRRKKKRKSSSSSESTSLLKQQHIDEFAKSPSIIVSVKQEIVEPTSHRENISQASSQDSTLPPQNFNQPQVLPMNLATEHDRGNLCKLQIQEKMQDANPVCDVDTNNLNNNVVQVRLAPDVSVGINTVKENTCRNIITTIKEEIIDNYNPTNVLCKKVRQAQQAKRLWTATASSTLPSTSVQSSISLEVLPPTPPSNDHSSQSVATVSYAMGPPAQMDFGNNLERVNDAAKVASRNSQQIRAKKLRYIQAKYESFQQSVIQQQMNSEATDATGVDKDVLPENLGLPRERVISICNMDKHELDDYLNGQGEESSQDQEAELLQYFQTEETDTNKNTIIAEKNVNINNHLTGNNQAPGTVNSQTAGWQNLNKVEKKSGFPPKDREEITNLRNYLQQNFNKDVDMAAGSQLSSSFSSNSAATAVIKSSQNPKYTGCDQYTGMYPSCSASASLAIMSQRHMIDSVHHSDNSNTTPESSNTNGRKQKRKANINARTYVSNSPTTRHKNFSFVPISPNINTPNDCGLFASPRSTPVIRKPPLNKQQSLPLTDQNLSDPMIGANRNCRTGTISAINSASAPPSPSVIQQRFQFTNSSGNCGVVSNPHLSTTFNASNINGACFNDMINSRNCNIQCGNQNLIDFNVDGSSASCLNSESRSQSVPLHCRSPAFNNSSNYAGFSSACSSVAQTPVPQEFADFTEASSILDIFSNTSTEHHQSSIKIEDNSGNSLLDVNNSVSFSGLIGTDFEREPTMNSVVSRSVPSTPLPNIFSGNMKSMIGNISSLDMAKYSNKMYDISKSVPTTPIGNGMSQSSFRYSPEFNRDVLINGNTVENLPSPYQPANLMSDSIESSLDTIDTIHDLNNFVDVSGSNFETDILNNL